ncbi:MAG: ParB N-terminal domain-containing protein [Natronohydrobacter sp.]|nr:ParB N-terminal domain-containing protein [Natronohydrobacter sp.]
MAKRRRLDPIPQADLPAPEQKSALPPIGAPIARVAQETAREAAFEELRTALTQARAEGRLIQKLPLDAVQLDHLLRDRIALDEEALVPLMESLRARGQQVPIEVTALGGGRFGLISGWRRMAALRRLAAETGEARFGTVLAILRQPETAGDAYLAMVEENEIRLGLSHYERARIVLRAVEAGVFPTTKTALQKLFAHGSRARRSKIGSFLGVVEALDGVLRFPTDLGERLGLALAAQIEADPGFADRLRRDLAAAAPESAEAERLVLEAALRPAPDPAEAAPDPMPAPPAPSGGPSDPSAKSPVASAPPQDPTRPTAARLDPAPGVVLEISGGYLKPVLTLSGPKVDQAFKERLIAWLQAQGKS